MNDGGRLMGLDYGARTVGVALSDPLGLTAQSFEIIRRREENQLRPTLRRLQEIISEYDVREIVLGLPLNMDDSAGERAEKTLAFRTLLEKRVQLPVHMMDERLTSYAAEEAMTAAGIAPEEQKRYVDRVAAAIILQDYMNAHGDN